MTDYQNDFFPLMRLARASFFAGLRDWESITRPLRLPHLPNPFPATPVSERYANAHDAAHGLDWIDAYPCDGLRFCMASADNIISLTLHARSGRGRETLYLGRGGIFYNFLGFLGALRVDLPLSFGHLRSCLACPLANMTISYQK